MRSDESHAGQLETSPAAERHLVTQSYIYVARAADRVTVALGWPTSAADPVASPPSLASSASKPARVSSRGGVTASHGTQPMQIVGAPPRHPWELQGAGCVWPHFSAWAAGPRLLAAATEICRRPVCYCIGLTTGPLRHARKLLNAAPTDYRGPQHNEHTAGALQQFQYKLSNAQS